VIDRQEIMEFAREFGLAPHVIEKDYVLGWMLAAISADPDIGPRWVFKGGTCLKKCFFETYRFSEDLDFTLTDPAHLDEEFLLATFTRIAQWIYDRTGIEVPRETIRFELYDNPRGNRSAQGRVGYRGPMGRGGDAPRVKLDLTNDEVLVLEPVVREVHHPYSDRSEEGMQIRCYSFEEVFAEKLRALAERGRPRDLYDVIHLYRHDELRPDRAAISDTLGRKCEFKGIPVPTMASIGAERRVELEADWAAMLGHQLPALSPFDQSWQELPALFDWLHGTVEKIVKPAISVAARGAAAVDDTWRPPAMAQAWHAPIPVEIIRFAAANRLCVDLTYQGSHRLIEPYSLRRTKDGNLLLYAVKHDTGEDRSYRVDRIQGAQATETPFTPRYVVELTPVGPISAPPTARGSSSFSVPRTSAPRPTRRASSGFKSSYGPKYVFECMYCGKKFTRGSYDSSLNPHKDKNGYPCPSRTGMYVDTKY
jgi:predicted nucleotidyltransferase component of viral defense system